MVPVLSLSWQSGLSFISVSAKWLRPGLRINMVLRKAKKQPKDKEKSFKKELHTDRFDLPPLGLIKTAIGVWLPPKVLPPWPNKYGKVTTSA